jgi:hypothetical protein
MVLFGHNRVLCSDLGARSSTRHAQREDLTNRQLKAIRVQASAFLVWEEDASAP